MDIQTYLTNICQHAGIDASQLEVVVEDQNDAITVTIKVPQEESGLLIGFHGDTLAALQRLTRVVFQEEIGDKRLTVNINEYREQRAERLQQMAEKAAYQVLETGRSYHFNYMPAHERFVIHSTIGDNPEFSELESVSEGEGRDRMLVIRFKDEAGESAHETEAANDAESTPEAEIVTETDVSET